MLLPTDIEDWPDVVVKEDMSILDARQILRQRAEEARQQDEAEAVPTEPLLGELPIGAYHIDNLVG